VDAILENHPKARIVYVKRHPLHVVQSLSRSSFSYASNDRLTNSFVVRAYWRPLKQNETFSPVISSSR
jgi:hypothetical protein